MCTMLPGTYSQFTAFIIFIRLLLTPSLLTGVSIGTGGTTTLSSFLTNELVPNTSFSTGFVNMAATTTPSWTATQLAAHTTSFYTTADPTLYSGLLTGSNTYLNDLQVYVPAGSGMASGQVIAQAMYNGLRGDMVKEILAFPDYDSARPTAIAFLTHFCSGDACSIGK